MKPARTIGDRRKRKAAPPIEYVTVTLRCPVCSGQFTFEAPEVGGPVQRETDFRPLFNGPDPTPWRICSCPSCHYTAYPRGFGVCDHAADEEVELGLARELPGDRQAPRVPEPTDDDLDDLRRWIRTGELVSGITAGEREPFGGERYLLGARVYEFLEDGDLPGVADFLLRASWCARGVHDRALELRAQQETVQRLQQALDQSQVADADRPRTLYLLAELSRRAGDFSKAVDLFGQIEALVDADEPEGALLAHLAKRQQALAVVKSDVNAVIAEDDVGLERDDADEE